MHTLSFCFPLPSSSRHSAARRAPLCALEETRRATRSFPAPPDVIPHNYRVLPADVKQPPSPPKYYTLPTFGFLLEQLFFPERRFKLARKFGGIYTSDAFTNRLHVITDYNAISAVVKDSETFISRNVTPQITKIFGDKILFNMDGAEHFCSRNAESSTLSASLLPFYFNEFRRILSESWENLSMSSVKKTPLDPFFRELYARNMIRVTTGLAYDESKYSLFSQQLGALLSMIFSPEFGPVWDDGLKAKDELYRAITRLIGDALVQHPDLIERIRSFDDKILMLASRLFPDGEVNFLIMYIADSGLKTGISVEENDPREVAALVERILVLWFAGTTTTAPTTTSAAMILGTRPGLWAVLRAEQDALVAEEQGGLEVKFDQLSMMPLLESFLFEVLRFYPTLTGIQRIASRDAEAFGYHIPKGDLVFFDLLVAMRDERYYDDAETFKFDRFVRDEGKPRPPRVLSFGPIGSAHYCLGAQLAIVLMKTAFASLLRRYTLELDPQQSQEWRIVPDCTPKSKVVMNKLRRREDI